MPVPATPTVTIPTGQWFNLIGPGGFCAEAPSTNGGQITQRTCTASQLMQWQFIPMNGGYVIRNWNKYVIDNSASRHVTGNLIIGFNQHNGKNQIWVPQMITANTLTFRNPDSNKCLDGTKIHQVGRMYHLWDCNNTNKNTWFSLGTPQAPIAAPVAPIAVPMPAPIAVPSNSPYQNWNNSYPIAFFKPTAGNIDMETLRN